jgi:uncharacterized delta-60 repeat protein
MPKNLTVRALLAGALLVASACFAADGDPDPGFGTDGIAWLALDGIEGHELRTSAVIALPDGKLLFGGSRNLLIQGNPDPHMRATLARMNADGSPDATFGSDPGNPGLIVLPSVADTGMQAVEAMQRLADGSIVVAGSAQAFGPLTGFVMKFGADGSLDGAFGTEGIVTVAGTFLHALAIDSEGRIVVAGEQSSGIQSRGFVARLGSDGRFDAGFGANGDGTVVFEPIASEESGYFTTLAVGSDDSIVVGGAYEAWGAGMGTDMSIARLDANGTLDASFANGGWRVFHMPDDVSTFNGINRLLMAPDGKIAIAAYRQAETTGVGIVLGRLDANGATDASFGAATTPGFQLLDVAPEAWNRYPSALVRQDDGKLLVSVSYATPAKQEFLVLRTSADGALDAGFGDGGMVELDLAPDGIYSDLTALTLQDGRPILAGAAKRSIGSQLVDLAAVRLQNGGGDDDPIFRNGFDGAPPVPSLTDYDDLVEGRLGTSFHHNGITYRECNGIAGVFPDGSTFEADYPGEEFIIEDASSFYPDFPQYGSLPNTLTFGFLFAEGTSVSIGGFVRATLDLDQPASAITFDAAYYENGPWGGIKLNLDAYRNGTLVGSDSFTIADAGGRDNAATTSMSIEGVTFDSLKLYATYNGQPTAPRLMIDDLSLTPAASAQE